MQKTKILSLAILAALLSSPCAWAAEPTPAAAETAAAQTDTMTTGSTEAAEDETTVYGNASVPMPDAPLDLVEFTAAKMVSGEKVTLADSYAALKNDENIVLVKNGADVTLSHGALNKTGIPPVSGAASLTAKTPGSWLQMPPWPWTAAPSGRKRTAPTPYLRLGPKASSRFMIPISVPRG